MQEKHVRWMAALFALLFGWSSSAFGVALLYSYDSDGRLVQASYGSSILAYQYDADGNLSIRAKQQSSTVTLTVNPGGNGAVTGSDGKIRCGETCSADYVKGTLVSLEAEPDDGYRLVSWEGDCASCGTQSSCSLSLDADTTCSATFTRREVVQYSLTIEPSPAYGTVRSDPEGIACGPGQAECSGNFDEGNSVTLEAQAGDGYRLASWTRDCASCGSSSSCTVTMDDDVTCGVVFRSSAPPPPPPSSVVLSISTQGPGSVASSDGKLECGDTCSADYTQGDQVTLTASPDDNATFVSWSGDCTSCGSNPACSLTLTGDTSCGAEFESSEVHGLSVDVKINGSDGPVVLSRNDSLNVTLSVDASGLGAQASQGISGDYFLWAEIPGGSCFCYSFPDTWIPCPCQAPTPTYQGPIVSFSDLALFSVPCEVLPEGGYRIFFAVDTTADGTFNANGEQDQVSFTVQ